MCMSTVTNWAERFAEIVQFVGVTDEDRKLIKASGPLIIQHARQINDFVYDHILEYPEARKFFVTAEDKPDGPRIEANKETMISWLRATAAAPSNDGFARYLAATSQMHRNIPLHRPGLSPVPPRYIIGIISCYQTVIADLLQKHLDDASLVLRTSMAWNKWLMAQIDLLLASYLSHD